MRFSSSLSVLLALLFVLQTGCSRKSPVLPSARRASPSGSQRVVGPTGFTVVEKRGQKHAALRLANELEVLMISDPRFQKSSAAMMVPVGSWSDPADAQGLAHYLEHMLFLGTKDFPDPGSYRRFITQNGGSSNAYTSWELTNYHFEIRPGAYQEAIHRFSQFFTDPQFNSDLLEREKNAVDSEYRLNFKDEVWRLQHVTGLFSPEGHPFRTFSVGSKDTLAQVDRERVIDFYEKHYSANTMKLVMMSPLPVEDMRKLAETYFSKIPNRNLQPASFESAPLPVRPGLWMDVKAVKQVRKLRLLFPLPALNPLWRSRAEQVLSFLIGHEGSGTLAADLKRDDLITELMAGAYNTSSGDAYLIELHLTERGLEETESIIQKTFAYIRTLQRAGYQKYTFEELKTILGLKLENRGPRDDDDTAASLAAALRRHPALEVEERTQLMHEFNSQEIRDLLGRFNPDNFSVLRLFPGAETNQRDTYFDLEYRLSALPAGLLNSLRSSSDGSGYRYPARNPYIPTRMNLLRNDRRPEPYALTSNSKGRLFFLQENSGIAKPKGFASLKIWSEASSRSSRSRALTLVILEAIRRSVNERAYPMKMADYEYEFRNHQEGLLLEAAGYSQALVQVVKELIGGEHGTINAPELNDRRLEAIKRSVAETFANMMQEDAYAYALRTANSLLTSTEFEPQQIAAEIPSITLEEARAFASEFFSRIRIDGLTYGNLDPRASATIIDHGFNVLKAQPLADADVARIRTKFVKFAPGLRIAKAVSGQNNNNALITLYHLGDRTDARRAETLILGKMLSSAYFNEMRTKQQLGYVVHSAPRPNLSNLNLLFLIQGEQHAADDMGRRSNQFIQSFAQSLLTELSDEDFGLYKQAILEELEDPPLTMEDRFDELKSQAIDFGGDFASKRRLIAALRQLDKAQLQNFVRRYLLPETASRLTVYYSGSQFPPVTVPDDERRVESRQDLLGIDGVSF